MTWRVAVRRGLLGMLAGIAIGAVISEATYYFLRHGEERGPRVVELVIPQGTAARIDRGETEIAIPAALTFVVGDTLVVRNADTANHQLGPLYIPAGTSASVVLNVAQSYSATCSFQPTRSFGIEVQPALTLQTRALGILQTGVPLGFLFILYGAFAVPYRARRLPA